MRNKQVEFNHYIYTYQNCPVLAMKYLFLNTVKPVFEDYSWEVEKVVTYDRWSLKPGAYKVIQSL